MSEFEDGYRLISGRSQDRNLLPVSHSLAALQKLLVIAQATQNLSIETGVAQRKRAGLITPRSDVQIISPVSLHFSSFTEAARRSSFLYDM